MKIVKMMHKNY